MINGEGNLLGNIRGALTGIKDFGGQAVEKTVDGANNFLNRFADVGDSAYNVFNQFSLSNLPQHAHPANFANRIKRRA